jgi:DNA-binding MarR family transcriptional regulator/GNAT superfamily N-acetyltransferase
MDFIKELGYLAIASRMKRLSDRFMRGANKVYKSLNIDFEPRFFTVFYLIFTQGKPLSISEISSSLNITHPAVIQAAQMLIKKGLIDSYQDDADRRIRRITLTAKGKRLVDFLLPIWNDFEAATVELFTEAQVDMLSVIQNLETQLDKEGLSDRIIKRIKKRQYNEVEILDFAPKYREYFKTLNYEWLEKYFKVEELDKKILTDPEKEIIQKGGFIFFARIGDKIVGTAALLRVNETTYELNKMAVTEEAQSQQAGRKLLDAAVNRAKEMGAKKIILKTDNRLRNAVNLYHKLGFKVTPVETTASGKFEREKYGILMKLDLS